MEEAYKLGADDYITKPLSLEYLQTSVSEKIANLTGNKYDKDPGH
jgi:DNA-binding response OmpR family regulator